MRTFGQSRRAAIRSERLLRIEFDRMHSFSPAALSDSSQATTSSVISSFCQSTRVLSRSRMTPRIPFALSSSAVTSRTHSAERCGQKTSQPCRRGRSASAWALGVGGSEGSALGIWSSFPFSLFPFPFSGDALSTGLNLYPILLPPFELDLMPGGLMLGRGAREDVRAIGAGDVVEKIVLLRMQGCLQ